jgi:hypothetical protein
MIKSTYQNYQQLHQSDDSPIRMEPFERHFEQSFPSSGKQLMCWGEESNYLDSEFCPILEQFDQQNLREH